MPRTRFGSNEPLPELRLLHANEDISGVPWIRVLMAVNLNLATVGPHLAHYLQHFVQFVVVAPGAATSPTLDALAKVLGNTHVLVLLLGDTPLRNISTACPLERTVPSPLLPHEIKAEALPEMFKELRAPAAARRCIALAKRICKELQCRQ
jgi:hypothetical protein